MLTCQKDKFSLDPNFIYLNCAYMSPNLKTVEAAGIAGIKKKSQPYLIREEDFFNPVKEVKKRFAQLINSPEAERIAIIPAASYGLANVAKNIKSKGKKNIIIPGEQFPSNYYAWEQIAKEQDLQIKIISRPNLEKNVSKIWNEQILDAIDEHTLLVAMSHVHWADGSLFNLKNIRAKTTKHDALLVIDGTQSVGALPLDVQEVPVDALICASYKYLMGPYGFGLAYYGPAFDDGKPIEDNWINRKHSDDFQNLVNYQPLYQGFANRYSVGEQSNFIFIKMMYEALGQLLEWTPQAVQNYCSGISESAIASLRELGCTIEDQAYRGSHLFGLRPGHNFDMEALKKQFEEERVLLSLRGDAIRIAPNVYNEEADFMRLLDCFRKVKKGASIY